VTSHEAVYSDVVSDFPFLLHLLCNGNTREMDRWRVANLDLLTNEPYRCRGVGMESGLAPEEPLSVGKCVKMESISMG
jgi:hypothetical protein